MRDKFDSVIRSHQQPEQLEGIPLREDLDEDDDDASIEDGAPNDNNNSSGTVSEISMNHESSH